MASRITVLSSHTLFTIRGDLQIYFGMVLRETVHHAQAHVTYGALTQCALFFGRQMNKDGCRVWSISMASFGYVAATLGLPAELEVGRSWLLPTSFLKFLTRRSLKSLWVYLAPHEDNRIQLLNTVRSRGWKNNFLAHLKLRRLIE